MFIPIVTSEERTTKRQPYAGLGFSEWDPGMWENSKKIVRNEQEITGNGLISCRKTEAVRIRWLYEEELRKASPLVSGVTGVACWQYASSHPPLAGNEACSSIKTIGVLAIWSAHRQAYACIIGYFPACMLHSTHREHWYTLSLKSKFPFDTFWYKSRSISSICSLKNEHKQNVIMHNLCGHSLQFNIIFIIKTLVLLSRVHFTLFHKLCDFRVKLVSMDSE